MVSFRRRSRFVRALQTYGLERCSMTPGQLWVGRPPDPEHRHAPVDGVPPPLRSVCFVEGPEQAGLIAALAVSPEAETLEHLMIGTTHAYIGPGRPTPYDISAAVAALAGATMPALTRLVLGDMERLFNGHAYYGRVGDVTHAFDMAPGLLALRICGCMTLSRPVSHARLEGWHVDVDDIGVAGGPLSQDTVSNILGSRLPRLRTLELALDEDDVQPYDVPEPFFADNGFPALERFGMDCLTPDAERRLRAWAAGRALHWTF